MGAVLYFFYYCKTSPDVLLHTNQSRMKIHSFSEKRPLFIEHKLDFHFLTLLDRIYSKMFGFRFCTERHKLFKRIMLEILLTQ